MLIRSIFIWKKKRSQHSSLIIHTCRYARCGYIVYCLCLCLYVCFLYGYDFVSPSKKRCKILHGGLSASKAGNLPFWGTVLPRRRRIGMCGYTSVPEDRRICKLNFAYFKWNIYQPGIESLSHCPHFGTLDKNGLKRYRRRDADRRLCRPTDKGSKRQNCRFWPTAICGTYVGTCRYDQNVLIRCLHDVFI